jgi:hypothetical protein
MWRPAYAAAPAKSTHPDYAAKVVAEALRSTVWFGRQGMRKLAVVTLGALALAGCATKPATQVTRFHLNQPIARGQIVVEPMVAAERNSLEFRNYASIVGAELARLGFAEAPGLAPSEQVAALMVERGSRETLARSSGVSIGLGGGSFGRRSGVGVGGGVSFPIGGNRPQEVVMTRLTVQIKRRSEGTVIWEGRAETAAKSSAPEAQPAAAVQRLASALFRDFPGPSGRTIAVK